VIHVISFALVRSERRGAQLKGAAALTTNFYNPSKLMTGLTQLAHYFKFVILSL
jgi:hypothetical protein